MFLQRCQTHQNRHNIAKGIKITRSSHLTPKTQALQTQYFITLAILSIQIIVATAQAENTPLPTASQSIGSYTNGCISGAQALPLNGVGFQVMRVSRHRYFGHPDLLAFIEKLGSSVASADIGSLLIGDLGQTYGGPMPYGHRSHQNGLDVDIWFLLSKPAKQRHLSPEERETWSAVSLIDERHDSLNERQWTKAHAQILETAARQTEVERIFVHPRIKQNLCQSQPAETRSWLRKIRPWWKHDDHFHVRLHCPSGNPNCQPQEELPAGDGCDASLDWWFSEEAKHPAASTPAPPPPLPPLCEKLLREK